VTQGEGADPAGAIPGDASLGFLIAGEPSGDAIGARLMAALKRRCHDRIRFAGIGGEQMQAQGLQSLFAMSELSLMGVAEVLPRIPALFRRMGETAAAVRAAAPDALVSIDVPGFCFGVWRRLKGSGVPLIHYVGPTVWAWRPWRVRKFARVLDHLMVLFPFEPPFFERAGLPCNFVGHPVLESGAGDGDGAAFRARHGIPPDAPVVCLLPGSRRSELARLLPPFAEAVEILAKRFPALRMVVPAGPGWADALAAACRDWPVDVLVLADGNEKFHAMAASTAALAASGTVALELALAGVPMVIAYRVNWATYQVVRRMVKVKYANLINLLLDRPAVPELLQDDCRGGRLAAAVARLLDDGAARDEQRAVGAEAVAALRAGDAAPSDYAAETVLRIIGERRTRT